MSAAGSWPAQPLDPALLTEAAGRLLAHLLGRLFRQALQLADADQSVQRQESDAGVGLASHRGRRRRGRRRRTAVDLAAAALRPSSAAKAPATPAAAAAARTSARPFCEVNGILYFSTPDNAWAMDARDGHELWHYFWKTKGGTHIGNRGLGMWGNWLYMETPDDYLVCLDARTGKERWHKEIANFNQQYFSTMAPDRDRQSHPHRHRQRSRRARLPAVARSGNRRRAVEVLHRADEEGRSRPRDLGQSGRRPARRRQRLDSRLLRSRNASLHLRHRQSVAGVHQSAQPRGRQSVHLLDRRDQRRYRQDGLVLPDDSARHARLGFHRDADPGRRRVQRQAAQDGAARRPQRLLLHARPPDRRASGDQQILRRRELGEGDQRQGPARPRSRQGFHRPRLAGVAQQRRRDQLAASQLTRPIPACSTCRPTKLTRCTT